MTAIGRFRLYAVTGVEMPVLASLLLFKISNFFKNLLAGILIPRTSRRVGGSFAVRGGTGGI